MFEQSDPLPQWNNLDYAEEDGIDAIMNNPTSTSKDVEIAFGTQFGIWALRNRTTWAFLHPLSSKGLLLADVDGNGIDDVMIDFGPGIGLWGYLNNSTWGQVHGLSPAAMTAGRFH